MTMDVEPHASYTEICNKDRSNLGEAEREFKLRRDQRYQEDEDKLKIHIDASLRAELLYTREENSRLNHNLAEQQQMSLLDMLTEAQTQDILKLNAIGSCFYALNEVWQDIEDIWG